MAAVTAAPQRGSYQAPEPVYEACDDGLVRKADGRCVEPIVTRNLFLYNAPAPRITYGPAPYIPDPKVHYNYVFVRTAGAVVGAKPIVVAPPQQKTLVYLLNKRPEEQTQQLIEVPGKPSQPEVYFVNYNDGENPTLPGGIDLETALSQSANAGQVIGSFDSSEHFDSREGGGSYPVRAPQVIQTYN